MPKLKNKSGAKKRFTITASGKVKAGSGHHRHLMRNKSTQAKRNARGTKVLFKADGDKVKDNWLRV
jgi:large subunit ribosomal protein L35